VSDRYLWDRGEPVDPEIAQLEQVLGRLRTTPPEPLWEPAPRSARRRPPGAFLAVAAALVLTASASLRLLTADRAVPSWAVIRVTGQPTIGATPVEAAGRLAVGEWLTTDDRSSASVAIGDIGRVDVEPATRLRLLSTGDGDQRLSLVRGTLHALVWAPPGQFVVETPGSTAVDLGCAYTLSIAADGAGVIDVTLGWVGFEYAGR
jgi:FecR protein